MSPHLLFDTNQVPTVSELIIIPVSKPQRFQMYKGDSAHMYMYRQFKSTLQKYVLILGEFCICICKQIGQGWEGEQWLIKVNFLEESMSVPVLEGKGIIP